MTNAAVIPEPGPFSYRLTFEHTGQEGAPHLDPMDVHGAWEANDRAVLDAVLAVAQQRWPGAVLEVRVNRKNMRGRILAGSTARRSVVEINKAIPAAEARIATGHAAVAAPPTTRACTSACGARPTCPPSSRSSADLPDRSSPRARLARFTTADADAFRRLLNTGKPFDPARDLTTVTTEPSPQAGTPDPPEDAHDHDGHPQHTLVAVTVLRGGRQVGASAVLHEPLTDAELEHAARVHRRRDRAADQPRPDVVTAPAADAAARTI